MASGPITSWQKDGETMETVADFIFLGPKITGDGDCSHEIRRQLLLGREAMTNLDCVEKQRCYSANKDSSIQSLSHARLFATPWTAAHQASLSITNSQSLLKLMSIELVMASNHLILCRPLLLSSVFPSIRVFSNESVLCTRPGTMATSPT